MASQQTPSTIVPSQRLAGKVAIVTGGAAGFGASIALHFVAAGAKVVVVDLTEQAGQELAASSEAIVFLRGDVTQTATWQEAKALAIETFGTLTTVINNAGITADPHVRSCGLTVKRCLMYFWTAACTRAKHGAL